MARGWESKSVEAQQEQAADKTAPPKPRLTQEEAVRLRQKESLRLARERVLQQMESAKDPRLREMLERSLASLDEKLTL